MKKTLKLLMSFVLLVSLLSMSAMATDGVDDIRFYDASSNKRIISFTENSEIYAKVNFTPTKSGTASVYAAFYRSNGALVKGEIIGDFAMTAGETIAYTTESFSALDVATVKLFAWDSNIVPLVKHGELEASDGETVDTIVKFESTKDGSSYVSGTQVTLGEIFTAKTGLEYALEADNISVTVSATDTAKATYTANETDWSKGTIDFSGVGNVTITITDNYLCTPASVTVMVEPFVTSFNADSGEYTFDDNTNYNVEDGEEDAVKVYGTAVVNITGGTYNGGQTPYGGSGNTAVYALGNSVVNISGGEFTINGLAEGDTGHIDLIYAKENATINISGGTFSGVGENAADVWLVNIKDADEDTAKIIITGGTFVNWNPAEKATDPNGKCYIAEGYSVKATVVGNDTHYTVVKNIDKFVAKSNLTFTHVKENGTIEKTLGDIFAANEDAEINNASVEVTVGEGCTYVKNDADWTASTLSFTGTGNVTITITDNVNCNTAEASVLITEPDSVEKFDIKSASLKVEQTVALGELFAEKADVTVFDEDITVMVTDAEGNSLADKITYVADATDWTKSTLTVNYVGSIKVAISDNNFCTATVLEAEVAALDKFTAKENLTFTHVKENGTIDATLGDIFEAIEGADINSASVEVTVGEGCTYTKNDSDWTASALSFTGTGDVTITITDNVNCKAATATVSVVNPAPVEKFTTKAVEMKAEQTVVLGELFAEKSEVTVFDEDITVTVTDADGNPLADKVTYVADATDWTKSTLTVNYVGSIKVAISDNNFCTATVLEAEVAALDKFTAKENLTFTHVKENGTIEKTLGDIFEAIEGADINSASVEVTVGEGCTYTKNDLDWTASALSFTGTGDSIITIAESSNTATATVTITEPEVTDKFALKFKNTDTYLYRVGNQNTVALGSLFEAVDDAEIGDVAITVEALSGNSVSGTYTKNATWANGTIKFADTGVVRVTIDDDRYTNALSLNLEVVNAKNTTTASFSGNTVLLNDVSTSTAISANGIVYGNGFTVNMENAPIKNDNGAVFHLYDGTILKNIKVIGKEFTSVATNVNSTNYGVSTVRNWGTVVIEDSYISGCRSAVAAAGNELTIRNSVIANGIYANVDFSSGILNLHNVTTINEPHTVDGKTIIGLGIVGNMTASPGRQINITGNLTQYNWVSQSDSENIKVTGVSNILKSVYTNDEYAQWRHSYNGTKYASTGIISLCEDFGESGLSGMPSNYTGKSVTASIGGITVNGYAWAPALGRDLTDEEMAYHDATYEWSAENQGTSFVIPAFDFTSNGLEVESGVVQIGYENGSSYTLSAETLDAIIDTAKYGNPLSYRVLMDGVDYTGKDIIFDETASKMYTITYVVTDDAVYDENGALSEATYEVAKQFKVFATVTDKAADAPAFTFHYGTNGSASAGTPHTAQPSNTYASTIKQIGETYYIMPDVSATTANAIGAQTVDGQTVYYPIVDGINVRSGNSTDYNFTRYYPVFKAVKISDNGTEYSYSTTTMPDTLAWVSAEIDTGNSASSLNDGFGSYDNQYLCKIQKKAGNTESGGTAVVKYSYTALDGNTYYYYVGYRFYDEDEGGICVTADTLVTLADGSQKRIDELTYDDELKVWDFENGEYTVSATAVMRNHGYNDNTVITMTFDDGTVTKSVNAHGYYDADLRKFVEITGDTAENYIGHHFVKEDGDGYTTVVLEDVRVEEQYIEAWSLLSAYHYNFITDGIFSISSSVGGLEYFMPFEYDENLKINQEKKIKDIETYGLYTYEEFEDILTREQFDALNMPQIKVSVGKGIITWDDLMTIIEIEVFSPQFPE